MITKVEVLESRRLTSSTHAVRFAKPDGFRFLPVQFCGLELETSQGNEEYSMSLACSPTKEYLEFGARLSESPWKKAFASLRPGDEAEIDGPYGHFVLDEKHDALFIAGGIGITPLKGMAEYAADSKLPIRSAMVYSNRTRDDIPYAHELDELVRANPRFQLTHTLTREPEGSSWKGRRGRIDLSLIQEAAKGLVEPRYYICGLPGMIRDAVGALLQAGVARDRLVYEAFWGYED